VRPEKILQPAATREEERIWDAYRRRERVLRQHSPFNPGQLFIVQRIERRLLATMRREALAPLSGRKILEVGCGQGYWLCDFVKWGATAENLTGIDLLPHRVAEAKARCPSGVQLEVGNGASLHFEDESFDIVLQATVFTSILDASVKTAVAAEMLRVLKPGGVILWYDFRFNNPRNADVRGVNRREIRTLFPGCQIRLERLTLAPPVARCLAPVSWLACELLEKVPWLRTHYLGAIRKPSR
jgi:SAM-dependent methyltransferase